MTNQNEFSSNAYIIKDFISKALSVKYFYLVSFIICFTGVFFLNKFSPTVYEVNSIIGPIEDKRTALMGSNDLFRGLGVLEQAKNLENDINNAKSFTLVAATLSKMNLEVSYFNKKNNILGQIEQIYPRPPFTVSIDKSHIQPINAKFHVAILDKNSFRLTCSEDEVSLYNYVDNVVVSIDNVLNTDTICKFNVPITNRNFKFMVSLNQENSFSKAEYTGLYYFEFHHLDELSKNYLANIEVKPVSIRSSLINVTFRGKNLDLTVDFLNTYLQTFLDDNLAKKNKISRNEIDFIDSQIAGISDSLVKSESKLKDYRSENQVMDLSYQGQRAYEQMTQIETDRSNLQIQERYYRYVLDNFEKNKDISGISPPSAANVSDPIMNSLILDLQALNTERSSIMSNNAEKNLFLGQIDNKIRAQKQAIVENVRNNLATLTLTKNELDSREEKLSKEISKLPRTELNMVSMERKFKLSDAIYTFLLQKRSEAAITMVSNNPDYEILEPAREITKTIISPKIVINWMLAFMIAILIPTVYIILKNFFNETIATISDVENLLKRSVLSVIFSNTYKTEAVVKESPSSPIAESFRNLRSTLFLRFKSEPLKVIMVTSSQPKDGKSFISFNLAESIASVGHKTILLDCDLRRPSLHENFRTENNRGITNYIADNASKESIIHNTESENLFFIPAGPLLANSSEMIEAGALDDLINYLRSNYDFVIIDTSPAGMVADATPMMKYASRILLICRNNFTRKDVFNDVLSMFRINKVENFDVVFNDLNIKTSKYGHYSNYYNKRL